MRKILLIMLLPLSFAAHASEYPQGIDIPVAGLGLSNTEIADAAKATLKHFGWEFSSTSDTSLTASVRGRTKLDVNFAGGEKVSFKYQEEYSDHKFFRRLRLIRKHGTLHLTDCGLTPGEGVDAATSARRSLVFALAKSNWIVVSTSESKIVARSPGNGRIEAGVSGGGTVSMKRWDEIEEEYTDPDRDRYISKIYKVYEQQQARCGR